MKSTFVKIVCLVALILLAAYPTLAAGPAALPSRPSDLAPVAYLPSVARAPSCLQGRVTLNGAPISGVLLDLRYYNGSSWFTRSNATTDAYGRYCFESISGLLPGERYYVRYQNTAEIAGRLWQWGTRELTSYGFDTIVSIGDFDLADIGLLTPDPGALVALPRTFHWARRPVPSDSYEFDLFDYADGDPFFYTNPPLGYVDSFTLNSLPPGFSTYTPYVWDVWVYSPDGGYGISYWAYYVGFNNAGQAAVSAEPFSTLPARLLDDLPERPTLP